MAPKKQQSSSLAPAQKWFKLSLSWHKKLGIAVAFFLMWLGVSGILLNHYAWFNLDKKFVQSSFINQMYGLSAPQGYQVDAPLHDWVQVGNTVYLNAEKVLETTAQLKGFLVHETDFSIVVFDQFIALWDDSTQQIIERVEQGWISPVLLKNAGHGQGELYVIDEDNSVYRLDTISLESTSVASDVSMKYGQAAHTLHEIPEFALQESGVSYLQFVLDLHSGNFFGAPGRWFYDLLGLGLIIMSLSGLWMTWFRFRQKRQKHSRPKLP